MKKFVLLLLKDINNPLSFDIMYRYLFFKSNPSHVQYIYISYVTLCPELFIIGFAADDDPEDRKLNPGIDE